MHCALHQVSHVQRIAAAHHVDAIRAGGLERPTQNRLDEPCRLSPIEWPDVEPRDQRVLPQARDGIGHRLAGPRGQDEPGGCRDRQQVNQRRGQIVQEVRVVHCHQNAPSARRTQRSSRLVEDGGGFAGSLQFDEVTEGAERNTAGGGGSRDPVRHGLGMLAGEATGRSAGQHGLSDSRRTHEYRAVLL